MWIFLRVEDAGSLTNGLREPLFSQLFGRRLGDETTAAAPAYQLIDTLYNFVR